MLTQNTRPVNPAPQVRGGAGKLGLLEFKLY